MSEKLFVLCALVCLLEVKTVHPTEPGPLHRPTRGEVWPKPQYEKKANTYFTISVDTFDVKTTNHNCTILTKAIVRCLAAMSRLERIAARHRDMKVGANTDPNYQGPITELLVELTRPCEEFPHLDMDESYNITVSPRPKLISHSLWGIVRGLETFTHLFYILDANDEGNHEVRINTTSIVDYPRYPYRGLLLDSSRHFLSPKNILKTLDAMAMNKLNVFHWHIVGDASFPFQSKRLPELSRKGAFDPSLVYTKQDIQLIINYAKDRGIRVVPEFNVPAHTRSWGAAYPQAMTKCYNSSLVHFEPDLLDQVSGIGPLNPARNVTYKLLRSLFAEVEDLFPDDYLHVGGDMDGFDCWQSNPEILDYMKSNRIHNMDRLYAHFMGNTFRAIKDAKVMVWQDVFDAEVPLCEHTIVQVRKQEGVVQEMVDILKAGHKVVYSSSWLLDQAASTFSALYSADPRHMVYQVTRNYSLAENVAGGEACLWSHGVDNSNLLSKTWPLASAVAEVLWSTILEYESFSRIRLTEGSLGRVAEQACRMRRRGVHAAPPHGAGFCVVH